MKYMVLFAALMLPCAVMAQTASAPPDFNTDIPSKAYTPLTVPDGYFQVESDLGNFSQSAYGNYSSRTFQTFDPVFKYGLPDNFDVEVALGGYINKWQRTGNVTVRLSGFGDITPRLRWNYYNDGPLSLGAIVGVKIPTASTGLGNGQVEYNFIALPKTRMRTMRI